MNNIKVFTGDRTICKIFINEWKNNIESSEIIYCFTLEDIEEIVNPYSLFGNKIYIIEEPDKLLLDFIDLNLNKIHSNNYIAIICKNIDRRLLFFKNNKELITDCKYIKYSDSEYCINFITKISGFKRDISELLYKKVGYVIENIENKNGIKTQTEVLNIEKIIKEIEKIELLETNDLNVINSIVLNFYECSSWGLVDGIINFDIGMAIRNANGSILDVNDFLMFIGLLSSELRLCLYVSKFKNMNSEYILRKIKQLYETFDDIVSKPKLDVHPFRIYKAITRVSKYGSKRYEKMLMICEKYNKLCRNDIPINFLVNSMIFELI
jgi:hypothetical protein